tara:strand:- start:6051 stop:6467 length:417 start_codon:yes stop_codon:yes gene_type:complete
MISTIEEYYELKDKYIEKYGEKTIVFLQVGNFYEVHSHKYNENQMEICEKMLSLSINRKNENFVSSFPLYKRIHYRDKLISKDYIVVFVDDNDSDGRAAAVDYDVQSTHPDEKSCNIFSFLYASCCPELYSHGLRTFD